MTLRLALRSLAAQPVRSVVLSGGFGLGIAAMVGLLGVGEVILEQSRSPVLQGGGDVVVTGLNGRVPSARFFTSGVLGAPPFAGRVNVASPSLSGTLYLVAPGAEPLSVRARGGIPSLERRIGDPETATLPEWQDAPEDRAWVSPDPADVLRAMDRFHAIPEVPARADTWSEWLYFNGSTGGGARFYLTFVAGPRVAPGSRGVGVRLQLEHRGRLITYSARDVLAEEALLAEAPDLRVGASRVRLDGLRYRIDLDLRREPDERAAAAYVRGSLVVEAVPGRSLPPFQIRGAGGWVSGYVVPVLAGPTSGILDVGGERVTFDGGQGYHDHNWGFWKGVTWQWGQVAGDGLSLVYGRIRPPADAVDPERLPGFLCVMGPEGPLAYATDVRIEEMDDPELHRPRTITVRGASSSLSLELELTVHDIVRTPFRGGALAGDGGLALLQLRATCSVRGRILDRVVELTAPGAAETFR